MAIASIILFFLYAFGLGFALCRFVKESDNFLEKNLIRLGAGLSALPIIGIIFSLLKIPVDWKIFLALSLIFPAFFIIKNHRNFKLNLSFKFRKSDLALFFVIFIFILSFNMYHKGAFMYPYLEDDDSWSHAVGVKYVSAEKTFFNPFGGTGYLDPYPPVYDGLLGLLNQTSASVNWTLKFFNALLISLSIMFFYLFVKELTANIFLALFSTIALSMTPAFLSHFIWAHSLIPLFIFLSFLFMERIKHDKRWVYISSFAIAAFLLTTIDQGIKFMMFFLIYFAIKSIVEKRFYTEIFIAGILGFIISLIWWIPISFRSGGIFNLLSDLGLSQGVSQGLSQERFGFIYAYLSNTLFYVVLIAVIIGFFFAYHHMKNKLKSYHKSFIGILLPSAMLIFYIAAYSSISEAGTADRIYDFNDSFIAKKQNMINNPIGIGIAIMSLLFIALLLMLYEQFSIVKKNIIHMPKKLFYSLYLISILNFAFFIISSISFSSFRFRAGTFLKNYMLENPQNYNYVYSFTFKRWGIYLFIISLLIMIAVYVYLIYKDIIPKGKVWLPISLFWFLYTFAGIHDIPTQLFTFRIWTLLAFTISILAGYGFITITNLFAKSLIPKIIIWLILIALIFYTSGVQKYAVNTAIWPPGAFWTSNEEIQGYIWFKDNLPSDTKVFTFSNNALVIALDKFICPWCKEVSGYQRIGFNQSSQQNYNWLKKEKYNYIIIDGQTARKFGTNETNNKLNGLLNSGLFKPVHTTGGFILLQTI